MEDLAVQVGQLDNIVVNKSDRPDTCNRKVERYRGAETASSRNKDVRPFQLFLPFFTKKQDLPLVPFEFAF
jgi:hypothetical protein